MLRTQRHRDQHFNCRKKRRANLADPCFNTKAHYQGVPFPNKHASAIHPLVGSVEVSAENGRVLSAALHLSPPPLAIPERQKLLRLPKPQEIWPDRITNISFQNASAQGIEDALQCIADANPLGLQREPTCDSMKTQYSFVVISSGEHMGADDMDCDELARDLKR